MSCSLRDSSGAIFIEFLFTVIPFLVLIFGLTQLAMLHVGGLAVERSAGAAARAAVVVLDDDPAHYGGEARNRLTPQRVAAIERAAAFPVLAVTQTPQPAQTMDEALSAWRNSPFFDSAGANREANGLAVTIEGSSADRGSPITVRVEYAYRCQVPVARTFMCGTDGTRTIAAEATLAHQAAPYAYGPLQ